MEVFERVRAVAGQQPKPPHLECFPGLTGFKHRVWSLNVGEGGAMNQVKPSEQVVATVSRSRLATRRPRATLVRALTQAPVVMLLTDRLAVFHSHPSGVSSTGGGGALVHEAL